MSESVQSKQKLSIIAFTASFSLFLAFILLDDFLFGEEFRKVLRKFVWIRLSVGFLFSSLISLLTFYLLQTAFKSLKVLSQVLQGWTRDVYEDSGEEERDDEIGELARHFRIALYQKRAKEENLSQETLVRKEREFSDKIQRFFHKIRLHTIRNLDITVYPRGSETGEADYGNVIPTADGCLGILAGFPNDGVIESAMKARIEGMVSLAQETTGLRGEDLLYKIDRSLRSTPISYLNLALFHLETRNGDLGILQYQKLPALLHKNGKTIPLENSKQVYYDFKSSQKDLKKLVLKPGEILVLLSDRLTELSGTHQASDILSELQVWSSGKDYKNSRELVLDFGRFLESIFGKKALSKASLLAIGRVREF